ncbi:hypothetical protein SY212_11250 [Ligilactobacillus agilis]|uniref:Uncharacterized protein n=1 Tax=Ligilactobacillus agilis TaxID=1601 RepID=A0A6F9XLM2_9LACO|nr:hypothetical protein [Ligilactobacillus agilis]GET06095.1 hypothetical protein SY212_11250 [Ligilactobacillus agilis]
MLSKEQTLNKFIYETNKDIKFIEDFELRLMDVTPQNNEAMESWYKEIQKAFNKDIPGLENNEFPNLGSKAKFVGIYKQNILTSFCPFGLATGAFILSQIKNININKYASKLDNNRIGAKLGNLWNELLVEHTVLSCLMPLRPSQEQEVINHTTYHGVYNQAFNALIKFDCAQEWIPQELFTYMRTENVTLRNEFASRYQYNIQDFGYDNRKRKIHLELSIY